MVRACLWIACGCSLGFLAANVQAAENRLEQAKQLEHQGQFKQAEKAIREGLAQPAITEATRKELLFELDRLGRIKRDFPLTRTELFRKVKEAVKGLTKAEFDQWVDEGRFDSRTIDGVPYSMRSSARNLFFRYPELSARRTPDPDDVDVQKNHLALCRQIRQAALEAKRPYVLTKYFDVDFTATIDADVAPPGATIRAWLPIPRAFPFQRDFKFLSSSPSPLEIAPEEYSIRSAYFEKAARAGEPTVFQTHFTYVHDSVRFEIDPDKVLPFDGKDARIAPFTREAPHVEFTPQLRALSASIVGDEKNPARAARKIYDWIGKNIRYSYAIEYSTIRNLSEYCRAKGFGDCGQQGMLFIALCRLNGIPARWQTGWDLFPKRHNIHDWSEIYLAPYGWVPVDVNKCVYAYQETPSLTPAERQEIADFYFGGLDPYRMACNSDHSQALTPAKLAMRSDTIDFQRGEFEFGQTNIYYSHFHYRFDVREIPPPKDHPAVAP